MVEKYLVFALECIGLNPSVRMYDMLMRKYLKKEFGVEVQDLVTKWTKKCWFNCEKNMAGAAPILGRNNGLLTVSWLTYPRQANSATVREWIAG